MGVLDLSVRQELSDTLDASIAELTEAGLEIDFASVTFMDASALGVVVRAVRRAREHERSVRLCNLQPFHRRLFDIIGDTRESDFE
jgi:anti-anti-sigma factor